MNRTSLFLFGQLPRSDGQHVQLCDLLMTISNDTVAVLLATFNGLRWLPEQVESILKQTEVNVLLFVSDDLSSDGTWAWFQELAATDKRVILLPRAQKFGSAAVNFYRLIVDANLAECDFIAFSDQDDIWKLDKLRRHIDVANKGGFDGVSSNVAAFWPDGKTISIVKSQSQRELDYIFGSAGPGCTYLMTPWLVSTLRDLLMDNNSGANRVALHDWLVYAICRAAGRRWYIDDMAMVRYRQHETNEFGANHGLRAKLSRLKRLTSGWYRSETTKILNVCMVVKPSEPEYEKLSRALCAKGLLSRLRLLLYVHRARRRMADRIMLAASIVFLIF